VKLVVVGQTPPPYNGQAKMIEIMLDALTKRYDVRYVSMSFSDSVSTAGKFSVGKIFYLFGLIFRSWRALGLGRKYYLYYPPASPNIVPVLRDLFFLILVRPFCKGLICQFHAGGISIFAQQHPFLRPLMMLAYGRMTLGIVNGKSCPDDPGFFRARVTAVIPHGLDLAVGGVEPKLTNDSICRILYVGIHTHDKGVFTILETARLLVERGVDFKIRTVGRWYADEEKLRFLKMRDEYGLQDKVQCVGRKTGDDLWREYANADVLFFPTKYPWETMGIVQLEAMAHGLPVVASDWPGPRDVVVDGETGFLCSHDIPESFADKLELMVTDAELRTRMGEAGRERYKSMYTVECYMERLTKAFDELA